MRLFLIRHAQSANNALPESQRVEDPPLTEIGQQQAVALAESLVSAKLDRIITSPFRRSLQTTSYIARRLQLVPEVWIDLHEQGGCYSGYEPECYQGRPGMSQSEIAAEFPEYVVETAIGHEGWWRCQPYENDEQAKQRARRLLERTLHTFAGSEQVIAYVMHADFKRMLLSEMFSQPHSGSSGKLSNGHTILINNTGVTQVIAREGRFHLQELNSISHLPLGIRTT